MTLIFSHSREIFIASWRHVTKTLRSSRNSQTWSFYIVDHQKVLGFEENRCQLHLLPSGMLNLDFLFWICGDYSCPGFRVISRNIELALSDPTSAHPQTGVTQLCVFWVGQIIEWRPMNGDWSMGDSWNINNFKQALVDEKRSNYKATFGAMRHSPTNERGVLADVKVIDVEKRRSKEHSNSKNYVRMNDPVIFAFLLSF